MSYFKDLIKDSNSRSKEATLSILGISEPGLREHLNTQMTSTLGEDGCFLAPPVFEHTFGWESSNETLESLDERILTKEMIEILNSAKNYNFPKTLCPYKHQLTAWKTLTEASPKSIVVTTGTGSGKTECFMIPIINDLIKEYQTLKKPLIGVRALFLYPLNALINSQQERLDAWTQRYDRNIRFCLYNGKTKETEHSVRNESNYGRNQILSRELLRKEPAPILMTNATMLEYMLVRHIDNPILKISKEQKSLRWIVLDEAHTYIGSQAAEISLLLKRVVQAFGKDTKDIRFIATSATIAGSEAKSQLKTYLADLAGVPESQVEVISGSRKWPVLPSTDVKNQTFDEIQKIEEGQEISLSRFDALSKNRLTIRIRKYILEREQPPTLNHIIEESKDLLHSKTKEDQQDEIIDWLDLMTGTRPDDKSDPFLKLRIHLFQRIFQGLWSCSDPNCSCKTQSLDKWPFGNVYVTQRQRCKCGALVFEVGFCRDCKTPYLTAEDRKGILSQPSPYLEDEFSVMFEDEGSDDDANHMRDSSSTKIIIAASSVDNEPFFKIGFNSENGAIGGITSGSSKINIAYEKDAECHCCGASSRDSYDFIRKLYLGSPFYISNAVPTILEYCPMPSKKDCDGKIPNELPGKGKKLITFSDSRQGTARISVKMQQDAERSRLRGLVYDIVQNAHADKNLIDFDGRSPEELRERAKQLLSLGFKSEADENLRKADAIESPCLVSWQNMIDLLSNSNDISNSILNYNKYANPLLFDDSNDTKTMAKVLLTREFARRPKKENSLETLGLIAVSYEGLNNIKTCPEFWEEISKKTVYQTEKSKSLSLQDWKDYLKVLLDFYVRENSFVTMDRNVNKWMGAKFFCKSLLPPQKDAENGNFIKHWPLAVRKGIKPRSVKLLLEVTLLKSDNNKDIDKINTFLTAAWKTLTEDLNILQKSEGTYALSFDKINFTFPQSGWICPITHKIMDTSFCSVTPYLPNRTEEKRYHCERITLPNFQELKPQSTIEDEIQQIRTLVSSNTEVSKLRTQNLWTDISDRTVEGGFYFRSAEHSAQQSSDRLVRYEELFKKGSVNVLNCSTTMEMGVDIGGISAVVMNNVPPHPANYLQRAGRAGRRSEARAIAYTLCKPDPHNQRVFDNPSWPFETVIPAPNITLSSEKIIQRHINAFLLSLFLLESTTSDKQATSLNVKWFFGGEESFCDCFINWLESEAITHEHEVQALLSNSVSASMSVYILIREAVTKIEEIRDRWVKEYDSISLRLEKAQDEPYRRALELELSRHEGEYLLRSLAERAFLPGYGFPTNVVNLNTYNVAEFLYNRKSKNRDREDSFFNFREQPSRSLEIAIREYAPGAQLVIDGRVYKSAGVGLNWSTQNRSYDFKIAWQCTRCGMKGVIDHAYSHYDISCPSCQQKISPEHQKVILRPEGFVCDFYAEPSNDVSSQRYIRVNKPRVQLHGNEQMLPDERLGYFRHGNNGGVFYHSSGEHDKGFAVCLKCGRAESMTETDKLPKVFKEPYHIALGGPDKQGNKKTCSVEGVKKNVSLGYEIQTDVIEFVFRNPLTQVWLGEEKDDNIVAMTLAISIRNAIAQELGISSTEMGYSYRMGKDIDTGVKKAVIQIYDHVSGGAGFVLAGLKNLTGILFRAIDQLNCPANCENVCSHCLAEDDSRIEQDELDRHATLEWINKSDFKSHIYFPAELYDTPGARFCTFGPSHYIKTAIKDLSSNKEPTVVSINLHNDASTWDLVNPNFYDVIMAWLYVNRTKIELNIPDDSNIPEESYPILLRLLDAGVQLNHVSPISEAPSYLFCQIYNQSMTRSLLVNNIDALIPNENWLCPENPSSWIVTKDLAVCHKISAIDRTLWENTVYQSNVMHIIHEWDGPLNSLNLRIERFLKKEAETLWNMLNTKKINEIEYTDRYLKTPWNLMVLTEIICCMSLRKPVQITIKTVKPKPSFRSPKMLFHDWDNSNIMKAVSEKWLRNKTGGMVNFNIYESNQELPHGRTMKFHWEDGTISQLIFDQGVGAWETYFHKGYQRFFDFSLSPDEQVRQMEEKYDHADLERKANWSTHITFEEKIEA